MLIFLMSKIANLFTLTDNKSELEEYINSRNPQTPCDVEYYTKQFDKEQRSKISW